MYEKVVVITRKTRLEELIERFNTQPQAKFYIEHAGGDFQDYQREHDTYKESLDQLLVQVDRDLKLEVVERHFLPNYLFSARDLVIAFGQDGLVANTAKYVGAQPVLGVNPDPARWDGILVPIRVADVKSCVAKVMSDRAKIKEVTLAEISLGDGQKLLAFNDIFIGARTHVSAQYRVEYHHQSESQSSSGLIVSTGAGSTGWLSSVFNMSNAIDRFLGRQGGSGLTMSWDSDSLLFIVREPFISKHSSASIVAGYINESDQLTIESRMSGEGTIFSDGIECDFLAFNAGSIAQVRPAAKKARL